jgi:hypothetical protein
MKSTKDKTERVVVHVRMRPYTEDELRRDNGKDNIAIEQFDCVNNVITGKQLITLSQERH